MENAVNQRIKEFANFINKSINFIAKEINISQSSMWAVVEGKTKPSYETIQKLISTYNINAEWLLMGEGNMLKSDEKIQQNQINISENNNGIAAIGNNQKNKIIHNEKFNEQITDNTAEKDSVVNQGLVFKEKLESYVGRDDNSNDVKLEKYASYFKTGNVGDGNIFNPNDFRLLIELVNQKNANIEQKEQYIIKLRKQIEEKHDNFVAKINENDTNCKTILAEKDRFIEKIIADRDDMIKKMMDRESDIVHNSYERNKENLERMDKMHEKMFELQNAILEIQNAVLDIVKNK